MFYKLYIFINVKPFCSKNKKEEIFLWKDDGIQMSIIRHLWKCAFFSVTVLWLEARQTSVALN